MKKILSLTTTALILASTATLVGCGNTHDGYNVFIPDGINKLGTLERALELRLLPDRCGEQVEIYFRNKSDGYVVYKSSKDDNISDDNISDNNIGGNTDDNISDFEPTPTPTNTPTPTITPTNTPTEEPIVDDTALLTDATTTLEECNSIKQHSLQTLYSCREYDVNSILTKYDKHINFFLKD
jgi:hypothetical protein